MPIKTRLQDLTQQLKTEDRIKRIEYVLFGIFAAISISCSAVALTGLECGWARWSKTGLTTKHSPFTNLMEMLFEERGDGFYIDPAYLHLVDKQLPNEPFDVTVKLGLRKIRCSIRIHDGVEVAGHIRELALALSPREDLDIHIARMMERRRDAMTLDYDGGRRSGYITGIMTMAVLALSMLLGTLFLFPCASFSTITNQIKCKAHLFGVQLVCLIIGCREDLERNAVVQHPYTPHPDWAWFAAMFSALSWFPIYFLSRFPIKHQIL